MLFLCCFKLFDMKCAIKINFKFFHNNNVVKYDDDETLKKILKNKKKMQIFSIFIIQHTFNVPKLAVDLTFPKNSNSSSRLQLHFKTNLENEIKIQFTSQRKRKLFI